METSVKLKTIKKDSIIKIEISDFFYSKLQKLFFYLSKDQEATLKSIIELKDREPANDLEESLVTVLALIYEVEAKAQQQGFLQDTEVPVPTSKN